MENNDVAILGAARLVGGTTGTPTLLQLREYVGFRPSNQPTELDSINISFPQFSPA